MGIGNSTGTDDALRRNEVYSDIVLEEMESMPILEGISREVTDFEDGDTLKIPTGGSVVIKDMDANTPTPRQVMDSGEVYLSITEYEGAVYSLTDKTKEDSRLAGDVIAATPSKMIQACNKSLERKLLAKSEDQAMNDLNVINGYAHRILSSGAGNTLALLDIAYAKASLDEADANETRVAIVSAVHELALNRMASQVVVSENPHMEGVVSTGFGKSHRFLYNLFGFDFYVTRNLPTAVGTHVQAVSTDSVVLSPNEVGGVTNADVIDGVVCQFLAVGEELEMPYMHAWRRKPRIEFKRDVDMRTDEHHVTARHGEGLQRPQSLVSIITSKTNY